MKSWLRLRVWLLALALLAVLGQPALAQGGRGGEVLFGRDFSLSSGERLYGDVVVFGGDAFVEEGGILHGDLLTLGGAIHVAGEVDGDVFAVGGDVRLSESALVSGDVTASGNVVREPGARVAGQVIESFRRGVRVPSVRSLPGLPIYRPGWGIAQPWSADLSRFLVSMMQAVFAVLAVVALGVLVVLLMPGPVRVVGESIVESPAQSIGVGLLTGSVAVLAVPLLAITCLGIPLAVALALALAIAVLFGWIAGGLVLGQRVLGSLSQPERQLLPAVTLGLVILAVLTQVPCLGFLVSLLVGTWGLGAVVLTRFGTVPYVPGGPRLTGGLHPERPGLGAPPDSPQPGPASAPTPYENDRQADGPETTGNDEPPATGPDSPS